MTFHHEFMGRPRIARQPPPCIVKRGLGLGVIRHVPGWHAGKLLKPEIDACLKAHDVTVTLQQGDERQEKSAVQPILVEIARRKIRGGDHDHTEFEQPREQAAEDHGVGDVRDMEFVEAKEPALFRYRRRGALNRIVIGLAVLEFLPIDMDTFVHVGHEFVKVNSSFSDDRAGLEKQIHQHGLAAADFTVDIEALERRAGMLTLPEQPTKR